MYQVLSTKGVDNPPSSLIRERKGDAIELKSIIYKWKQNTLFAKFHHDYWIKLVDLKTKNVV